MEEACDEDGEDDGADCDVEAVALEGEADNGEDYPGDGRGDEEKQAELDEAAAIEVGRKLDDAGDGAEVRRLEPEGVEAHGVGVVTGEIRERADGDEAGGDQDSDAQQGAHGGFEAAVIHGR